jgi:hypothetical protein
VTPPGGSRDDDNAPRGAAGPGQVRAGVPDDAPADASAGEPGGDTQLRAMRAVWLEMRDEDPPDRGLAALLAAAHHQAAAMQPRPSAWQRLLAALRRPPVLALATVTVLIAGAVLIGRRIPHEPAPGLSTSPYVGAAPPIATPLDHATTRTQPAMERGETLAVPVPQPAAPPPAAAPPLTVAPPPERDRVSPALSAQHARTTAPPPSASTARMPLGEARSHLDDRAAAGPAPADPVPEPAPPPPERVTQLGTSAVVPGDGTSGANNAGTANAARPARPELQTQPSGASNDTASSAANSTASGAANNTASGAANNTANHATKPVTNGVANPVAPKQRPSPASPRPAPAAGPYRQCEAAAGRGDCATVRRLVDQITRTDPGYPARVAKDSPVGKCLAE